MEEILGKNRGKNEQNNDLYTNVDLYSDTSLIVDGNVSAELSQMTQYFKDLDASRKYRLIFTINPVCSNVLFNTISEIVYKEGSDECVFFGVDGAKTNDGSEWGCEGTDVIKYLHYKGVTGTVCDYLNRGELIKDTSYTHKDIGPFIYHCGYDIFDNHMLRKRDFCVVNKLNSGETITDVKNGFNTIEDYQRDIDGVLLSDYTPVMSGDTIMPEKKDKVHQYMKDNIMPFRLSIDQNLTEENGWLGFYNKMLIGIDNFVTSEGKDIKINKCMNNNKPYEFIDMYPDRSLYSFLPKYNKYRRREEYNWDYCLTYPYRNYYDNELIQETISPTDEHLVYYNGEETFEDIILNGIKGSLYTKVFSDEDGYFVPQEGDVVMMRTNIKNNLVLNSKVALTFIATLKDGSATYINTVPYQVNVFAIGNNGVDNDYYFGVNFGDIEYSLLFLDSEGIPIDLRLFDISIRVSRYANSEKCKYYFRVFKAIPNFSHSNISNLRYISDNEIEQACTQDFASTLSKLGYERSIFNDQKCQILYNEDVDLTSLVDNLGRPLTNIYLTIVKRNEGHKEWYDEQKYGADTVEYSHCFGKVTSGLELPLIFETDESGNTKAIVEDYNIRQLHNIYSVTGETYSWFKDVLNIPVPAKSLEGEEYEVTINGTENENKSFFEGKREFFGDIVEFSQLEFNETTLEDVYFRFNTAQREFDGFTATSGISSINSGETICDTIEGEFANMQYHEIEFDDFTFVDDGITNTPFLKEKTYNSVNIVDEGGNEYWHCMYPVNIFPEGYYYKAHYPIRIGELDDSLQQGNHTKIEHDVYSQHGPTYTIRTYQNYYIEEGDKLYLYSLFEKNVEKVEVSVEQVSGTNYEYLTFTVPEGIVFTSGDTEQYSVYKPDRMKPDYAYELNDGTGRYIYRGVKKYSEITSEDPLFNMMFTNGAHYIQETINFYLKRQDPLGESGLSEINSYSDDLIIEGEENDSIDKIYYNRINQNPSINRGSKVDESVLC